MKTQTLLLTALLAALGSSAAPAPAAEPAAKAPAPTAEDPEAVLPGVSLEGLTPEQKKALAQFALEDFCYCGCPHTLSECLRTHHGCRHAPRMVQVAMRVARSGASPAEIRTWVDGYYASFDKRKRLDVKAFGPPRGNAAAPITLVEFSDFTCPFCRRLRPALEEWVDAHADRVKLYFKPFPIESHPGAWESALAAEWARSVDQFWPMHDAMFEAEVHTTDALAAEAEALGLDASDLRDAILSKKFQSRILWSQREARDAGVTGTPTLFMDGRMVQVPLDGTAPWLDFVLEDEEEWKAHGGWTRD
ncbi:MAG: thioredoxin domain-containing protein [Anaeromyxobacter sp.]